MCMLHMSNVYTSRGLNYVSPPHTDTLCVEAEADQTTSVSSPELLADGDEIDKDAVQNPAKDALTEVSSRF